MRCVEAEEMAYRIKPIQRRKARALGVEIKPSTNPKKKLDVFKAGKKIASIGGKGYKDYATYLEMEEKGRVPRGTAKMHQEAYKARHDNDRHVYGSNGYYADKILW